jgi:hypothetical protein
MRYLIIFVFILSATPSFSQTKTTEKLHKENKEAFSLFFYHNTLRMLNQSEDKDFDALIKDIEKMKFLMMENSTFSTGSYKKLVSEYKAESFEEIMTSRFEGKNFDVFLKEVNGKTKGMVVTVKDSEKLYILDIVGSIALDKITSFVKTLDTNTDIANRIKSFSTKE